MCLFSHKQYWNQIDIMTGKVISLQVADNSFPSITESRDVWRESFTAASNYTFME